MKTVNVGLVGVGTVGRGVSEVLRRNCEEISRRTGREIIVSAASARNVRKAEEFLGSTVKVYEDPCDVVRDKNVDIVIELIGGTTTARALIEESISLSKPVVTANKALIAEHGNELFARASANGSIVAYEAAVAGGIPIIKALREGLAANRIDSVAGIVNGTTNFILSEMRDKGISFQDALADAQRLGYAEDNRLDYIDGADLVANEAVERILLAGKSRAFGLEFLLKKNKGNHKYWIAYTLSKSQQKTEGRTSLETGINNGNWYYTSHDKTHDLSFVSNYKLSKKITFNTNFIFQTGQPTNYPIGQYNFMDLNIPNYGPRNSKRLPNYHRLDISLSLIPQKNKKIQSEWIFGFYNIYNRDNANSIFFRENSETLKNEAVQLSIFGIVPSITYNFKF